MRRAIVVVIAFLFACPTVSGGELMEEIKAKCAAEWPGDYSMQRYCIEKQTEAVLKISALYDVIQSAPDNDELTKIVGRCLFEWKNEATGWTDYGMVIYCAEKQIEDYEALKGLN